ncbi:hypothetical protein WG908_12870 [Sphingobium sp. AN641]|uniref:hypothetical protein n=1 Tax=Sphingobium sp. AN641 TaxID=3133443 RepID=UPI0030C260D6
MSFTINDIALLAITLMIGLLMGLILSGRGKYKRAWRDERHAHDRTRKDGDVQIAAAKARIEQLEQQRGPIGAGTATTAATATHGHDDLTRIRTVSAQDEMALNEAGYHRYAQIAALSQEEQATLEARLGRKPGLIARDEWREQAQLLQAGKFDEHSQRYDRLKTDI